MPGASLALAAVVLGGGCGARRYAALSIRHRPCPPSDRTFAPSPDPEARHVLVPGEPIGMLVCRYWGEGDSGPRRDLAGRRIGDGSAAARLARRLDALVAPKPGAPLPSCPSMGGRSVLFLFRYERSPDDPVRVLREGCTTVTNGLLPDRYADELEGGEHWPDEGLV